MMAKPRHPNYVRLAPHTHDWYVDWLHREGWVVSSLCIPTRSMILKGDKSSGFRRMLRYYEQFKDGDKTGYVACVSVPGARRPNERLSREEYLTMRRSIDDAYNRMGLDVPSEHNRRCMK